MKRILTLVAVVALAGCTGRNERESLSAASSVRALPIETYRRVAQACDSLIRKHAPAEDAHPYAVGDQNIDPVFREIGATKVQYGGRLDWESFSVFVSLTAVTNHWDEDACVLIWERTVEDHNRVGWNQDGVLRLFKPVSMQTNLWKGLREGDGQPATAPYSEPAARSPQG